MKASSVPRYTIGLTTVSRRRTLPHEPSEHRSSLTVIEVETLFFSFFGNTRSTPYRSKISFPRVSKGRYLNTIRKHCAPLRVSFGKTGNVREKLRVSSFVFHPTDSLRSIIRSFGTTIESNCSVHVSTSPRSFGETRRADHGELASDVPSRFKTNVTIFVATFPTKRFPTRARKKVTRKTERCSRFFNGGAYTRKEIYLMRVSL